MKKQILFFLFTLFTLFSVASLAQPVNQAIEMAEDLASDAAVSRRGDKPIVFFVTANHCPYCEKLRQEYFKFSSGDERFLLRELELDEHHSVVGFNGGTSNHQLLANRYKISLTPTVAFVGPNGEELTKPIVGVLTMDYYNYYFEKALGESISALKGTDVVEAR